MDATGAEFWKKGDRVDVTDAPLRETLAAAVLKAAGYRPGTVIIRHDIFLRMCFLPRGCAPY